MDRKILTASEGMLLTNGTIYGRRIALGDWDSAENYHEISLEEYEQRMREEEETADDTDYITALESLGVDFNA